MSTDTSLLYYDQPEQSATPPPPPRGRNHRNSRIENTVHLTPEEVRILKECNKESFYYRCIPFAVAAMAATHLAVKKGMLSGHAKYGSAFKQVGAALIGWFAGKLSYRNTCEDKFLHLENSSIADAIRKRRGITLEMIKDSYAIGDSGLSSGHDSHTLYSDADYHSSSGSLNLDVDKNIQYSGLDDRERPTVDSPEVVPEKAERPSVTYQELRRRNREMYEQQLRSQQSPSSNLGSPLPPPNRSWDSYSPVGKQDIPVNKPDTYLPAGNAPPKNKYGDAWGS